MSDDLSDIFDGEPERIATGFLFTEGPFWHPDGSFYFTDIHNSRVHRISPAGVVEIVRENTNAGNGVTFDLQGRLVLCEGNNRRVTRMEADGSIAIIADSWLGEKINRPNDVVARHEGSLYFTDPGGRLPPEERELDFSAIFRIAPHGRLSVASADCEYPNGIAFSPDGKVLYASNSRPDRYIRAFDVRPDGSLSNSRVFADMSAPEEEVPDGMAADEEGRVFCTGPGGTWIFDKEGDRLGILRTPEVPANCAYGGPDHKTLYLTARTSVYTISVEVPGVKTAFYDKHTSQAT